MARIRDDVWAERDDSGMLPERAPGYALLHTGLSWQARSEKIAVDSGPDAAALMEIPAAEDSKNATARADTAEEEEVLLVQALRRAG